MSNASRRRQGLAALACAVAVTMTAGAGANGGKFYSDDPITRIVDAEDASAVQRREIDLEYDTLENLFSWPGDQTPNVRAQNLNTIDEVPDSTWFTNRLGTVPVTVDELVKGPGSGTGPAPGGWTVISAKNDGVMPGFTVRDAAGQVWFIKFDPPGYPAMATGTEVLVARLFWGLGYHVPETHLATLRPEELTIDDQARIKSPSGNRRRFKESDIRLLLRRAHRESDGSYRVVASKALEGQPVGGFRFYGTRSDDPNDVIPHEHRRELRGYGTFAAWLNHVDSKSINTLDTVVEQDGKRVVRHHLLDFGSTIGSAGVYPREAYEGWEYLAEGKKTLAGMPSLGLYVKNWRTIPLYRAKSVGAFPIDNTQWDPERWKPRYAQFRVPIGAPGRQVLGRAAAPGIDRRDAEHAHRRRPIQRSEIRGDALEVPDRAPQRDSPSLPSGREPGRRRAPVAFGYVDVPERRGGCGRGARAQRVRRGVAAVRQCDRHDDEPRRDPRVGDERQCAERSSCGSGHVYPRRDLRQRRAGELDGTRTRLLPARGGWLDAGWLRTCAGRQSAGKQGRQPPD